jgi:hypothetical protein
MLLGMVLVFGPIKLLMSFDWEGPLSASNRLAIVADALSFLIVLAFLEEFQAFGMAFVGLGAILGILLLKRRMKARAEVNNISCVLFSKLSERNERRM